MMEFFYKFKCPFCTNNTKTKFTELPKVICDICCKSKTDFLECSKCSQNICIDCLESLENLEVVDTNVVLTIYNIKREDQVRIITTLFKSSDKIKTECLKYRATRDELIKICHNLQCQHIECINLS